MGRRKYRASHQTWHIPKIVEQVGWGHPKLRRNKKGRHATHYMIGLDHGGTIWTICIELAQRDPEVWRAITGWRSDKDEQEWYRRAR